ncbi:helix-turn-helix transcriptional regulator [Pseudoalteromonas sp. Hal040]|uniref:helix-turn-helix domain-containing protein n=1 Tax=unclassified Pseudoalteromonas TaxID=194690 RepID=UPI00301C0710
MEVSRSPIPYRIKEARLRKGVSQKSLGIQIGFDEGSASSRMNHYEKGRHTPDINTLKKIAEELDVPLAYFFCESDLNAELSCLISKLSDEKKQLLINELSSFLADKI